MKIVYLCEFATLLGGERSLLVFLDTAVARGLEPVIVCPSQGPLVEQIRQRGWTHVAWRHRAKESVECSVRALARESVHIVHANSLSMAGIAREIATRLATPAVLHVRDVYRLSHAQWATVRSFNAVIAVSSAVGCWLGEHGVTERTARVISNAVVVRPGLHQGVCPRWQLSGASTKVACIGQICLRKGQDVFLRAAERLAPMRVDIEFVLVGERYSCKQESVDFESDLRKRASSPGLAGRTYFLGYRDDVPDLLPSFDVVVVASRQEPFSRVLLECLAAGVPTVATDVGGNREILDGGRLGLLVPPDDPDAIAHAIEKALNDEQFRSVVRQEGPRRARCLYSPDRQVDEILGLYQRLLSQ